MCDDKASAASAIPTCFTGAAQSPVDLDAAFGIVQDQDPGQVSFLGYNDQLAETPMLRLRDFTVQLDFEDTLAISYPTVKPTGKKKVRKEEPQKKKKKRRRKNRGNGRKHNKRRVKRNANVPSITGGALGNST